jgi:hypothetical protein
MEVTKRLTQPGKCRKIRRLQSSERPLLLSDRYFNQYRGVVTLRELVLVGIAINVLVI